MEMTAEKKITKIVHVTSVHDVRCDTRILTKECTALAMAGYQVSVVAPTAENTHMQGVDVIATRMSRGRLSRMTIGVLVVLWRAWRLDADVYHFHDPELLPGAMLFQCFGKRVVFDMHENLPKAILTKEWIPRWLRRGLSAALRWVERGLLRRIPVVFAEESYREDYTYVQRYCVVQNMPLVDRLLTINEPKNERPSIGYVGAVDSNRGCFVTLRALALLKKQGRSVAWYCIGPLTDALRRDMEEFAADHGLEDVHVLGWRPAAEALPIMARCHAGLALLGPCPNYLRSYPTKMFEYMALGLPVIVSDFPLYRDVVERQACGLCVDPLDCEAAAAAIARILDDPESAARMGEAGRRATTVQYNWSEESRKLVAFYQTLS